MKLTSYASCALRSLQFTAAKPLEHLRVDDLTIASLSASREQGMTS